MFALVSLQASPAGVATQSKAGHLKSSSRDSTEKAQQAPNAEVFPGSQHYGLLITLQSWFISSVYR